MKNVDKKIVKEIGDKLKVNWSKINLAQFKKGMEVEFEHGKKNKKTNVTNDNLLKTGKIALAHLLEMADYYTKLKKMEKGK